MRDTAKKYLGAGLSVIPTGPDKLPLLSTWKPYQNRLPTETEAGKWFKNAANIAVICGAVSGNLEGIDFDNNAAALGEWSKLIEEKAPGLFGKLVFQKTPHGAHVFYRCQSPIPGNLKLAMLNKNEVLIETRGEGGYILMSPSKGYELKQGDFTRLSVLTPEERNILIESARELNQYFKPQNTQKGTQASTSPSELLPGQDYDERADIRALLLKHGWTQGGTGQDGRERWVRPGKGKGYSATLTDGKIFYVFSSNGEPFETGKGYGPFGVYTILEHGGDFRAATRALSAQGYGTQRSKGPESKTRTAGPSMADLREYIDFNVVPGQKITTDEICRGLACYKREEKKIVYKNITRLCVEGILIKDDYLHGGYRRVTEIDEFDLSGDITEDEILFNIKLPLDLHNLIKIKPSQLLQVSGRYDSCKSSLLFQIMGDNYREHKIIYIVSEEWSLSAIKERMDILGIPRPHQNIKVVPMKPGYEDAIPAGRCIAIIDYIRADENPYQTDAQIQRVLKRLSGGIAIFATQKHPGLDKPVGGQFAIHACHHIIMLDKWKELFICKIFRSKNEKNLEGYFKTFKLSKDKRLTPCMDQWKPGQIIFNKDRKSNDGIDGIDGNFDAVKPGGPHTLIKKESNKERKLISSASISEEPDLLRGVL
jgi:hypothetical protein